MTDGADDGNRTILIRPTPGRRQPNAAPAGTRTPPAARPPEPSRQAPAVASPTASIPPATGTSRIADSEDALATAAAPLLQLMARLHNAAAPPDSGNLREWCVRQIRVFERDAAAQGVPPELLRPAHYAICVSLDDIVLNTPWGSAGGWRSQPLVATFHRDSAGPERFFELLREMCNNPRRFLAVIKLMYLCLSFGFLGRYRAAGRGAADTRRIREDLYAIIVRQQKEAEAELSPNAKGVRAPHKAQGVRLPVWVAASAGLGIVAALFGWFSLSVNSDSDALQARARDAPPSRMPAIARAAFVDPPPAVRPAPPPEPSALDKVRAALKADIDQGFLEVTGSAAQPIVRIAAKSMFAPGSAAVQSNYQPLLTRIGQTMKGDPGSVRVIGYTDSQPFRSAAFPSNIHLSSARAQAAGAIIAAGIGDASRLSAEGRGDADPIAPNDTPQGRDRNQRIEVVLTRQGP
jgi:type VI secretion system protein ImpK